MPSSPPPTDAAGGRVPDRQLRAIVADDRGDGPAVVLLHGQPGSRRDWQLVVRRLPFDLRVVVPDRPGYGRTGGPAGGFSANAHSVLQLMDRLGIDRATFAAHSWGGGVALELARTQPDRVSSLVLVSSIGGAGSVDQLDAFLAAPVIGPALAIAGLVALTVDDVRRTLAPVPTPADPVSVPVFSEGGISSWRSFVAEQRAMLDDLPALTAGLPGLRVPTTVVTGEVDRVVRPQSQRALADSLKQARVVSLPGQGHLLLREAPDVVADAILRAVAAEEAGADGDMIDT